MSSSQPKIILHVDMDAFFASVEQLMHPEWVGKPVIVGADPQKGKGRGVVAAASYEARKFGVHSAMPISKAYRLCPSGIFAPPHGEIYHEYSKKIFKILDSFSPLVEPLSIDEAFMDMSGSYRLFGNEYEIGGQLKQKIYSQTGLTASVGIATCKSVAKIASDFDKPDGLTVVHPDKIQDFLDPLPVTRLWGIGKKTFDSLQFLGIKTVKQLRSYPLDVLKQKYGKMGDHIYRMARGEDEREVVTRGDVKSVSNERTFGTDQEDFDIVRNTIFALTEKVGGRLRRAGIRGQTVQLKIRFEDFKTFTRSHTLNHPTSLTHELFQNVELLLAEFDPLKFPVRLVGVGVSHLVKESGVQLSLWDMDNQKKMNLDKVMDKIQDKYGKGIIMHAQALNKEKKSGKNLK